MTVEQRTSIVWEYAPAPEATDHLRLAERYGLFIGGTFCEPAEARYVPTINPATEEPIAEIAWAGPARRATRDRGCEGMRSPAGLRYRPASAASTCSGSRD